MTPSAQLLADLTAAPDYLSPCPDCTVIAVHGCLDRILGPDHIRGAHSGRHSLSPCCPLSRGAPWLLGDPADCRRALAAWWTERRQRTARPWVLERLRAAGLEASAGRE